MARGDAAQGADLDLIVDFTDEASLLDEVGLRLALRDLRRGGRRRWSRHSAARGAGADPSRSSCALTDPRPRLWTIPAPT
ncbi:hypothetical protein [Janibacter sp. Soil728]|uniref:hypothetical protein n=1 Tax=Janibacter sp. Soil728 TaxID=1736393 RepID=UPI003FA56160